MSHQSIWEWSIFGIIVITLLVLDLFVLHRKEHEIRIKESLLMSLGYITIGILFGLWVWYKLGAQSGKEYLTGFIVEKTLSMDNIFLMSVIFSYFAIPKIYQHRVLFFGILGALLLRGILIGLGAVIVAEFNWVLYIFGAFLIITGIKMLFSAEKETDVGSNFILKFMQKHMRVTGLHGHKFWVRMNSPKNNGQQIIWFTPLFVALILIEITDLIFAVDSVPAIFAITTNPYIVYTSNIFAILGLRALYFAISTVIYRFRYVQYALAIVLMFIGSKVFIIYIFDIEHFPASISLGVTIGVIALGVLYSLYKTRKEANKA